MKNFFTIFLVLFSIHGSTEPVEIKYNSITLNGFYSSQSEKSKSIAIILHGTRGHQNLELISSLRDSLLDNGVDSLTINLSYGINNRVNDFLSCDIEHKHKQSDSQYEIKLWYEYIKKMGYKKIYLIGHSRGGLDIINFYENLDSQHQESVDSIFLLAPISETWESSISRYKENYDIDINDLVKQKPKKLKINFLGCEDATVYSDSFLDYYLIGGDGHFFSSEATRFSDKGLNLHLFSTSGKVYVITASEDTIAPNTYGIVRDVITKNKEKNIELYQVDGANHFFRDFYFDDLTEIIMERIN
ncbi:alpha/beta hydrolase [Gammaproteobacteria bacterium]|nr:alpha/beta hydrolase [Gammaproteobacteria bacterium]